MKVRLLSKQHNAATTTISNFAYTLNNLGQRTSITKTGSAFTATNTDTIGYDAQGQVINTTNSTDNTQNRAFTYDAITNNQSHELRGDL